jgi:hypothetical protein
VYIFLTALSTLVLCVGLWLDNEILSPVLRFWWLAIVAGYLAVCLLPPMTRLRVRWKLPMMVTGGVVILGIIVLFDDTLTIYLTGVVLLFILLFAEYLDIDTEAGKSSSSISLVALVAFALLILPVAINRVVVKLPNLSADTYLTVYSTLNEQPDVNAVFSNLIDDHLELTVGLGTQFYFQQPHEAPLLKIEILREGIVVRILSISYQSRIAYLSLPLFHIEGDALERLVISSKGNRFNMEMEGNRLLVNQLELTTPVWIQLPHMDSHKISLKNHALAVLVRWLVWLIICFALIKWCPENRRAE